MRDRIDGIKTREGRVVYDRKKHRWNISDFQRIRKTLSIPLYIIPANNLGALETALQEDISQGMPGFSFGGGESGGAGASGEFSESEEYARIIVIMEEK